MTQTPRLTTPLHALLYNTKEHMLSKKKKKIKTKEKKNIYWSAADLLFGPWDGCFFTCLNMYLIFMEKQNNFSEKKQKIFFPTAMAFHIVDFLAGVCVTKAELDVGWQNKISTVPL